MPGEKKVEETKAEEVVLNEADREVLDYAKQEEAEADRILAEATGQTVEKKEDDKKAGGDPENSEKNAEKKPGEEKKEPGKAEAQETGLNTEEKKDDKKTEDPEDLTKDLTVENAQNRIGAAQRKMHEETKRANTAAKEITRLQTEAEDLKALIDKRVTEEPGDSKEATKEPEKKEVVQTDSEVEESLQALEDEYPEIAKPMKEMLLNQRKEVQVLKDKIEVMDKKEADKEKAAVATAESEHKDKIAAAHSDYVEVSQDPLFDEWINGLPAIEKAGAQLIRQNGTTQEVIELLTSYKKANGYELPDTKEPEEKPGAKKVDSKLEEARKHSNPSFKKAKDVNMQDKQIKFTQEEINKWSDKEWNEREAEVDDALSKGLVA